MMSKNIQFFMYAYSIGMISICKGPLPYAEGFILVCPSKRKTSVVLNRQIRAVCGGCSDAAPA